MLFKIRVEARMIYRLRRSYIDVNLKSIVILCNWVDGMNRVKKV